VAGADWHPQPHVPVAGALAQLQHHPIRAGHLAEMGAGASGRGGADEQWRRQLDQRRRRIEQALVLQHEFVVAQGDAAAQLMTVGSDDAGDGRGQAAKAIAGIAEQHHLAIELLVGLGEDGDRVPSRRSWTLVEGMAAVAVSLVPEHAESWLCFGAGQDAPRSFPVAGRTEVDSSLCAETAGFELRRSCNVLSVTARDAKQGTALQVQRL